MRFSKLIKNDTAHECMTVMSQCPKESYWAVKVESIIAFIEQLIKTYDIDESRVYFEGVSHNAWDCTYDKELLEWLLAQKK